MFLFISKFTVFGQVLFQDSIKDIEKSEINYIIECIKNKQSFDGLIEWSFSSSYEKNLIYKSKRGRLSFFLMEENSKRLFLRSIVYYRNSFQKVIFLDDTLTKYEINNQIQFRVFMSKKISSTYFCMISSDGITVWVLTRFDTVNSFQYKFSEK
jgi:hypothetical protein